MTRLVSGVVLAAAAVAAIVWLPLVALRVVVAAIAAAAAFEYAALAGVARPASRWLIVAMAALTCWALGMPAWASVAVATAVVLAWLAVEVLAVRRTTSAARRWRSWAPPTSADRSGCSWPSTPDRAGSSRCC